MNLPSQLESLLFVAGKSLTTKKLAELTSASTEEVKSALRELQKTYRERTGGIRLLETASGWQMATAPEATAIVETLTKEELSGELTKPQLETLTIIGYRGPIAKGELEEIRGVNCAMILRNLLIRGLIEEDIDPTTKSARYGVTHEFLRFLGIGSTTELPEYENLKDHDALRSLLQKSPAP